MKSFQGKTSVVVSAFGLFCFVLAFCLYMWSNFCAVEPALVAGSPVDSVTGQPREMLCDSKFAFYENYVSSLFFVMFGTLAMFVAFMMKMNV
jgi:hypothetical protein